MKNSVDFDIPVDRTGTSSLKWDWYKGRDVIPLWVADMDFSVAPAIVEALQKRVSHDIFGYTIPPESLFKAIMDELKETYHWEVKRDWIVPLSGVVSGLNVCCRAVGELDDEVLVPVPVYPPFLEAPQLAGKNRVAIEMTEKNGRLVFDPDVLLKAITPKSRLLLLCSPHNPGGTVFSKEELVAISNICMDHNIIICSDEIHNGLVLSETKKHSPTASLSQKISENTITLMSPSKTFNIPGLGFSFAVIENSALRKSFMRAAKGILPEANAMGLVAAEAAYTKGRNWHRQMIAYLKGNLELVLSTIKRINGLEMLKPEATYLAWIDAHQTGLDDPAGFFEAHGVGLSDGKYFGKKGYVRLNFACHRSVLSEALTRMEKALNRVDK